MKILFVYQFLTLGGCEAVIRNRHMALKTLDERMTVDALFMYKCAEVDSRLADHVHITDKHDEISSIVRGYDVISVIDTPQLFGLLAGTGKPLLVEVHTPYSENRRYLRNPLPINTSRVVTPTSAFAKTVASEMKSSEITITPLHNPLDASFFEGGDGARLGLSFGRFVPIFWVGRLDKLKNWTRALDMLAGALDALPDRAIELFMVGWHDEIGDVLSALYKRKLAHKVRYLRTVDFALMPSVYQRVAAGGGIYLSTSDGESFGMTVVEAMASGLPCVLHDLDVFREVAEDRAMFFRTDAEGVGVISDLLTDAAKWKAMSGEGRQFARRFHPDATGRRFHDLLMEVA